MFPQELWVFSASNPQGSSGSKWVNTVLFESTWTMGKGCTIFLYLVRSIPSLFLWWCLCYPFTRMPQFPGCSQFFSSSIFFMDCIKFISAYVAAQVQFCNCSIYLKNYGKHYEPGPKFSSLEGKTVIEKSIGLGASCRTQRIGKTSQYKCK